MALPVATKEHGRRRLTPWSSSVVPLNGQAGHEGSSKVRAACLAHFRLAVGARGGAMERCVRRGLLTAFLGGLGAGRLQSRHGITPFQGGRVTSAVEIGKPKRSDVRLYIKIRFWCIIRHRQLSPRGYKPDLSPTGYKMHGFLTGRVKNAWIFNRKVEIFIIKSSF